MSTQVTTVSLENSSNIYSPVFGLEKCVLQYCRSTVHCQIHSLVSWMSVAGSANFPSASNPSYRVTLAPPPSILSSPFPSFLPSCPPGADNRDGSWETCDNPWMSCQAECDVTQNVTIQWECDIAWNVTFDRWWVANPWWSRERHFGLDCSDIHGKGSCTVCLNPKIPRSAK